jgi:hypothetical protein
MGASGPLVVAKVLQPALAFDAERSIRSPVRPAAERV